MACTIFAFAVWFSFIHNFKSFWCVQNDFGRGFLDITGCIFSCICVVQFSRIIDRNCTYLAKFLAQIGRCSILVLCIHIIELNLLPWRNMMNFLEILGFSGNITIIIVIFIKLLLIFGGSIILSNSLLVRKVFSIK